MRHLEVWLPIALLAVKFLFKLFIDRAATVPEIIQGCYALPVDVVFISASFAAGWAISSPAHAADGLFRFVVFIALAVLIVVLWRRCNSQFDKAKYLGSATIFVLNAGISAGTLISAISLLTTVHQ